MAGILFIGMLFLFLLGIPIASGIGMASAGFIGLMTELPLTIVPQRLFTTSDSFPLMAIPFFVLSGALMESGGISERLIKLADTFVGHKTGGLAMVVIITSMFFCGDFRFKRRYGDGGGGDPDSGDDKQRLQSELCRIGAGLFRPDGSYYSAQHPYGGLWRGDGGFHRRSV